ncbi:MAG: sulfatase [Amphiplicatus sp.]
MAPARSELATGVDMRALITLLTIVLFAVSAGYAADRPNIVLIVADDHGLDAIGAYGNDVVQTPNLDRLAAEGVRFMNAHAAVSSCSPSRSVLLTGKQNHENGMYGLQHWEHHFSSFDDIKSLPVMLTDSGYRTGRVGKVHLAPDAVYKFDSPLSDGAANDMASVARSPVEMVELSEDFIAADGPFFLYFATDDPHRAFPFDTYPAPNSFGNRNEGYPGVTHVEFKPEDVIVPSFLPDLPAVREELAQYYSSIARLDQGVGALRTILEKHGKLQDTIIIYLSDNGIAFPGAKTTLYQPGIKLPLIIRDPKSRRNGGDVSDALVSWVDITPTILDYANTSADGETLRGVSLKEHVQKGRKLNRAAIFGSHTFHEIHMYYPMRMIRTKRYKLIHNIEPTLDFPMALDLEQSSTWQAFLATGKDRYAGRSKEGFFNRTEFELYDLVEDPDELKNLADDPQHREVLNKLKAELKKFMVDTKDPWLLALDH